MVKRPVTMTNKLTFTTNSLFDNVVFDKDAECCYFYFVGNIYVSSSGFWRLLIEDKIDFVSLDHINLVYQNHLT
jgi:hypothetical protein